jgi:uncharacterized alpha-E superfamily protein
VGFILIYEKEGNNMLNRMAESYFWIGRYIERVDSITRLIDVNYHSHHVLLEKENNQEYIKKRFLAILGEYPFAEHLNDSNNNYLLDFLIFEQCNDNSILSCLGKARHNVRLVREQLPEKIWDTINTFYLWLKEQEGQKGWNQLPYSFCEQVHQKVSLFNGIADSTMLRENEWNFIQAGRFIERAGNSMRTLQLFCNQIIEESELEYQRDYYHQLISILESVDGLEAFRRNHANQLKVAKMFDFLVLNESFPRSVLFSLTHLEMFLKLIEKDFYSVRFSKLHRLIAGMKGNLSVSLDLEEKSIQDLQFVLNENQSILDELGAEIDYCFFYGEPVEFSKSSPPKKVAVL